MYISSPFSAGPEDFRQQDAGEVGADQRGGAGPQQEGLHEALQGARRDRQGKEGGGAGGRKEVVTGGAA